MCFLDIKCGSWQSSRSDQIQANPLWLLMPTDPRICRHQNPKLNISIHFIVVVPTTENVGPEMIFVKSYYYEWNNILHYCDVNK